MGREGAAAPAGLDGERGGLEGAARADSVESGGWGSKGRRWNLGEEEKHANPILQGPGAVGFLGRLLQSNL